MIDLLYVGDIEVVKLKDFNKLKKDYNKLKKENKELGKFFINMYGLWEKILSDIENDVSIYGKCNEKIKLFDQSFIALKKAYNEDNKSKDKSVMNTKSGNKFMKLLKAL